MVFRQNSTSAGLIPHGSKQAGTSVKELKLRRMSILARHLAPGQSVSGKNAQATELQEDPCSRCFVGIYAPSTVRCYSVVSGLKSES